MIHLVEEIALSRSLDRYAEAFPARAGTFLLDGGGAPEGKGRLAAFAMLGADPVLTFRASRLPRRLAGGERAATATVTDREGRVTSCGDDPFTALRALLSEHAFDAWVSRPLPFMGGFVGYIGYEAGQMLERLPGASRPGSDMPDVALDLHRWVLGTCRESGRAWLSVLGEDRGDAEQIRDAVLAKVREVEAADRPHPRAHAEMPRDLEALEGLTRAIGVREALTRSEYLARVLDAKRAIADGDAFELCLTQRLEAPFAGDPWALYRALREMNPAPFAAMLDLPEGAVVSSSPERFVRLDAERVAESRPIKGTRPRGATPDEDARLARELATSSKDRAENAMIVDLVRNDLGRVSRFGTVAVSELCAVEPYATVHQLVSTVRAELAPGKDAIDLVRACMPPGSMTGAPKIEAMSILERLEPTERGPYAGALGYFDLSGMLDLSVVIRTVVVKDGLARFHVGGAVVADSEPSAEHDETLHKARALVAALASSSASGAPP